MAGIDYVISGSNATYSWIASVDESGVRQFRSVEVLMHRTDYERARVQLELAGFIAHVNERGTFFLLHRDERPRWATEVVFSDEPIPGCAAGYLSPLATAVEVLDGRRVLKLADLVHFQLARYRLDDAVDLRDMLDVGVIDASWVDRFPEDLAKRLQHLVDTPDG